LRKDGSKDPNFGGGDGVVKVSLGVASAIHGLLMLGDHSIVAVGYAKTSGGGLDFALARFNPNGSLDKSFGSGGHVITDGGDQEEAEGVTLLANGRLLVVGHRGRDMYVRWYYQSGAADGTSGVNGYRRIAYGVSDAVAFDAVPLANGRAAVVGFVTGDSQELAVVKLTPGGDMDQAFGGGDGLASIDLGGTDAGYGCDLSPNGRLVIGGVTDGSMLLARVIL
jgi:uncharacterized delta-60 repeat protein